MNIQLTNIPEVVIVVPSMFEDDRGYFFEAWNQKEFDKKVRPVKFVQDNESKSTYGVLRGIHFQKGEHAQSKLVRVVKGMVLDVAVDLRVGSPTFMHLLYCLMPIMKCYSFQEDLDTDL